MMLKSKSSQSKRSAWTLVRAGLAGLAVVVGGAAVTAGCLNRPVAPATPKTSNVYVDEIRQTSVDKIDLLFMIDNSISMADKQAILADAVPILVQRLVTPLCVTDCTAADCTDAEKRDGRPTNPPTYASSTGKCDNGAAPEFSPIKDIHVGVVTSSLGNHGAGPGSAKVLNPCGLPSDDDHAHLLATVRPDAMVPTYQNLGFLKWDVTANPPKYTPPGESNDATFKTNFTKMVVSAGETGCGYEASLEAWYRFLIDPEPPAMIALPATMDKSIPKAVVQGIDQTVLDQRKAFLRADSLVAIVMLSDENDCSIQDVGYGYLIASSSPMFRSTSQCAANPNDNCCQSCGEGNKKDCPAVASDAECAKGTFLSLNDGSDDANLRCWHQKQRFGFDLLYPTARYSQGLSSPQVVRRSDNAIVANPLYSNVAVDPAAMPTTPRDTGLVFLAGIVGVPWQDIADDASVKGAGLRYLTEQELEASDRWSVILGSLNAEGTTAPVPPTDPFMIEQANERMAGAMNPITKDVIVASSSMNPKANGINGHEQINVGNTDLQYACIFPLATPLTCDPARETDGKGCDCYDDTPGVLAAFNRPLCQPPGGGAPTITQSYAKAYPGVRHLEVLKEFKTNSIVASICPKYASAADKMNNPDGYGYSPAVKAIIDRLKEALKGKCLPRPLVPATVQTQDLEVNQVPCAVIEAVLPQNGAACTCNTGQNRLPLDGSDGQPARPELRNAVLDKLFVNKACINDAHAMGTQCQDYCTCEISQLSGTNLDHCQKDATAPDVPGYCYINAAPNEQHVGNADLVKDCTPDSKRLLRFVGGTPTKGAIALVACLGASLGNTPAASTMP